ncbi:Insulin-like growth factor 1 receptor [Eumeta japonica]|uniref:Insulin-like growth factor 1 receptor n=1 Tax=Eumeta variegata TaxID=151549 RepID=A0A4C1U2V6_EUMVA|nr:Insulin-like growth factor 1 receptor [Eumeta japonica]
MEPEGADLLNIFILCFETNFTAAVSSITQCASESGSSTLRQHSTCGSSEPMPLSLFYSDASADGVEEISHVPRSRSHAWFEAERDNESCFFSEQPTSGLNIKNKEVHFLSSWVEQRAYASRVCHLPGHSPVHLLFDIGVSARVGVRVHECLLTWKAQVMVASSLLSIVLASTPAIATNDVTEEWVVGAAEGAEAAAEVVARLARERLGMAARAQVLRPPACANSTPDSPQCLTALLTTLQRSASPLSRRGAVWCLLGAVADAGDATGQILRSFGLEDLGTLAPPAARACLASAAGANITLTSHSDLRQTALVAPYELNGRELRIVDDFSRDPDTGSYYCEEENWVNGTYTPDWCIEERCATLLTGNAAEARLAARDTERWRWRVRVLALGPRLPEVVRRLVPRPLLLCAWAPTYSDLSLDHGFEALAMPPCYSDRFNNDTGCPYESRRLLKLAIPRAAVRHPRALRFLERVAFSLNDYRELAELTVTTGSASLAAERWLRTHDKLAQHWAAAGVHEMRVGVVVPVNGGSSLGGLGLAAAARLAEQDAAPVLFQLNVNFKVETYDGGCSARRSVKYVTDALGAGEFGSLGALVGPACAGALRAVAAQAHAFRLPTVTYTSIPRAASDPWLVLAGGNAQRAARALGTLAATLDWQRLATLAEASLRPLTDPGLLHADVLLHRELPDVLDNDNYRIIDEWAKEVAARNGRVLLVMTQEARWVRAALCAGLHAGLLPSRIAWLLPGELLATDLMPASTDAHGCTHTQLLQMVEGHISARNEWFRAAEAPPPEWVSRWRIACKELAEVAPPTLELPAKPCATPPLHAPLLYDAVGALTASLHSLLLEEPAAPDDLHDLNIVKHLMHELKQTNYSGLTGKLQLDENGERTGDIELLQWQSGRRVRVGTWNEHGLNFDVATVRWPTPDGKAPDDGSPRCALQSLADGLHADCQAAFAMVAGLTLAALAVLFLAAFMHCKRRYERRLKARLRALGLSVLPAASSLSRWELSRERVVINRKLGVGAFGTVYGGHALLADGQWNAVAVKTLKAGAPIEDKLDFLSEAEVMKRLDHENIVRLLGVVTATEPVCSVMEFMLYGDLKNYLLARRHLAGGVGGEGAADEVSPRRLTTMARDAARGLAYLADLKYVHRDIAARNCLVSATRGIKLADFGMARRVCETDYYRFSRRGPLPVRWMAPESVALGVFSLPSDVWSFGVLLYEIITFGALPFQGLANGEVLEILKRGGAPRLPSGVNSQVSTLIEKCWHRNPRSRPIAADLAATLADEPRLLIPCLDMPFGSLALDGESWMNGTQRAEERRDTSGSTGAHDQDTDTTYLSEDRTASALSALPAAATSVAVPDSPDAYIETDRFLS